MPTVAIVLGPAIEPFEVQAEWAGLREWVTRLRQRFPNLTRVPDCWWQHNDLVEILAALRDAERACYYDKADATAPVEWHRALRDMENRMDTWIKRLTCGVPGRGHDQSVSCVDVTPPAGWDEFIRQDVTRREARTFDDL